MLTNTRPDSDRYCVVCGGYDFCLSRWEDDGGGTLPTSSPLEDFKRDHGNQHSLLDTPDQQPAARPDQRPWDLERLDGSLLMPYQSRH